MEVGLVLSRRDCSRKGGAGGRLVKDHMNRLFGQVGLFQCNLFLQLGLLLGGYHLEVSKFLVLVNVGQCSMCKICRSLSRLG